MACIARCVATASVDGETKVLAPPPGAWVTARAPARVDLAGGWTDTPPICYDVGGCVVNLAVTVDGRKPIGARARRTPDAHVITLGTRPRAPREGEAAGGTGTACEVASATGQHVAADGEGVVVGASAFGGCWGERGGCKKGGSGAGSSGAVGGSAPGSCTAPSVQPPSSMS